MKGTTMIFVRVVLFSNKNVMKCYQWNSLAYTGANNKVDFHWSRSRKSLSMLWRFRLPDLIHPYPLICSQHTHTHAHTDTHTQTQTHKCTHTLTCFKCQSPSLPLNTFQARHSCPHTLSQSHSCDSNARILSLSHSHCLSCTHTLNSFHSFKHTLSLTHMYRHTHTLIQARTHAHTHTQSHKHTHTLT